MGIVDAFDNTGCPPFNLPRATQGAPRASPPPRPDRHDRQRRAHAQRQERSDAALNAHGLIKVRVFSDDRVARDQMLHTLADDLSAAPIQHIGKLLVLWRPKPEKVKEVDEDRMPGPRDVKVLKYSKRGGQRPEVKTFARAGQPAADARRHRQARPAQAEVDQAAADRLSGGRRAAAPHPVHEMGHQVRPEYVNRLYAMVRRNLRGDFKFVCLTDDGNGHPPRGDVPAIPPLNLHLAPGQRDGAWKKLTTFEQDLHGLRGTRSLPRPRRGGRRQPGRLLRTAWRIPDHSRPTPPLATRAGHRQFVGLPFELGAHADVLAYFRANMDKVQAEYRNEQAYLSDVLHKAGQAGLLA
jgi:hypothetical protein